MQTPPAPPTGADKQLEYGDHKQQHSVRLCYGRVSKRSLEHARLVARAEAWETAPTDGVIESTWDKDGRRGRAWRAWHAGRCVEPVTDVTHYI